MVHDILGRQTGRKEARHWLRGSKQRTVEAIAWESWELRAQLWVLCSRLVSI